MTGNDACEYRSWKFFHELACILHFCPREQGAETEAEHNAWCCLPSRGKSNIRPMWVEGKQQNKQWGFVTDGFGGKKVVIEEFGLINHCLVPVAFWIRSTTSVLRGAQSGKKIVARSDIWAKKVDTSDFQWLTMVCQKLQPLIIDDKRWWVKRRNSTRWVESCMLQFLLTNRG